MYLAVVVPAFGPKALVTVARRHIGDAGLVAAGTPLFDLAVDLSGGTVRDCPPASTCRIVLQEAAFVRWTITPDATALREGALLARLSLSPDDAVEQEARHARVSAAVIVDHASWWDDGG